jgi:hypothetical protein
VVVVAGDVVEVVVVQPVLCVVPPPNPAAAPPALNAVPFFAAFNTDVPATIVGSVFGLIEALYPAAGLGFLAKKLTASHSC